jgi:hypothetical protein
LPQDEDERFIVGLVLTYYRRHPERARTRLLDLLGEVLTPPASAPAPAPGKAAAPAGQWPTSPGDDDGRTLWQRWQQGVAPLKNKGR